jgi:ActR/RegA family two-component response regulator
VLRVLALTDDPPTRALLARVLADRAPVLAADPTEAIASTASAPPDLVFVDVSAFGGAALAIVHHVKALAPEAQVHALARPAALEAAAAAVALGGAGVLVLPLEGDEVLTAVADAEARLHDRDERERLRRATSAAERLLEAAREVSSLGSSDDRSTAAARVASILQRALGASDVAVYLAEGDDLFVRGATQGETTNVPTSATAAELDGLAVAAGWSRVPLAAGGPAQGHVLVRGVDDPDDEATRHAATTLAALAAVPLAMVSQAEASRGGTIKDPGSSAYSFAYYVDVAGREIDRARRHGRRFAIATIALGTSGSASDVAGVADRLLDALGDTAILARVDEHEFHALLPETDGLGAHACRRRILAKIGGGAQGGTAPSGLEAFVGVASFPHDGANLSQLLRVARRRSDACRASPVRRTCGHLATLDDMLWALEGAPPVDDPALAGVATRPLDLPPEAARALVASVLGDAARAGAAMVLAAGAEGAEVGGAVRQASATARDGVAVYVVDIERMPGQPTVEALAVLSEHATYALLARESGGRLRGVHSADPLLADLLAERVGRTAGLRLS